MRHRIRTYLAEGIGTAFLLATVVGSGIMGERLADGNVAIALLGNTLPTGAILFVLIAIFGPVSGAHFNPVVTMVFWLRCEIERRDALIYVVMQIVGGILGVWAAHLMFDEAIFQFSTKIRTGTGQWFAEILATLGLLMTILGLVRHNTQAIPMAVGLYITAAYWFTASTSFANPAVTIARGLSDTFAGIRPSDVMWFILAQMAGAILAFMLARLLWPTTNR